MPWYNNRYRCPRCGVFWDDAWSAMCDDECPNCECENITPVWSDDLSVIATPDANGAWSLWRSASDADDDPSSPRLPDMRRRHSTHTVDENPTAEDASSASSNAAGTGMHNLDRDGRRVFTDPVVAHHHQPASTSSAVDSADLPTSPTNAPAERAPRVRFSTDLERTAIPGDIGSAGNGSGRFPPAALPGRAMGQLERPGTPNLSVNTASANADPSEEAPVSSSSTSPQTARSRASPLSPAGRNRGYSLRSSLFRRNVENPTASPGSIIELQDAGASSSQVPPTPAASGQPLSSLAFKLGSAAKTCLWSPA